MQQTVTNTYQEVPAPYTTNKQCDKCGNRITKTFRQCGTISPFHDLSTDQLYHEYYAINKKDGEEWCLVPEDCRACTAGENAHECIELSDLSETSNDIAEIEKLNLESQNLTENISNKLVGKSFLAYYGAGEKRIAVITSISGHFGDLTCTYRFTRKDNKGLIKIDIHRYLKEVLEEIRDGG